MVERGGELCVDEEGVGIQTMMEYLVEEFGNEGEGVESLLTVSVCAEEVAIRVEVVMQIGGGVFGCRDGAGKEADFFNQFLGQGREEVLPDWSGDGVMVVVVTMMGDRGVGWRWRRRGRVVRVVAASLIHDVVVGVWMISWIIIIIVISCVFGRNTEDAGEDKRSGDVDEDGDDDGG